MAEAIPSLSVLIWISTKPLIRILIPTGIGFLMQKLGTLPPDGAKSCAVLQLRFALPCLLFAKIVPSLTGDNISALGPIFLCGFAYQLIPFAMGVVARAVTKTPRRFRYGMLSAYAFGNWGDLPFSMVASVTSSAPFNGAADETLGSAMVAVFILVNYVSLFPLQGLRLAQADYAHPPLVDPRLEMRYEDGEFGMLRKWVNRVWRGKPMEWEVEEERKKCREEEGNAVEVAEKDVDQEEKQVDGGEVKKRAPQRRTTATTGTQTASGDDDRDAITAVPINLAPPSSDFPVLEPHPSNLSHHSDRPSPHLSTTPSLHPPPSTSRRILLSIWSFFRPLVTSPPTVVLFVALVIALVPALRALFIASTSSTAFHPTAPDGAPPLAIIYETAEFVGNASVPLGLTILGASMAKLEIQRPFSRMPIASMIAMALVRCVFTAIAGFFLVEQLVRSGMVASDARVLRFVLTLFACSPTASTQIAYSQLFAPSPELSNAPLLGGYLIAQYIVWAFANVVLTAVSLNTIF